MLLRPVVFCPLVWFLLDGASLSDGRLTSIFSVCVVISYIWQPLVLNIVKVAFDISSADISSLPIFSFLIALDA